jgi:hypothetical protein
MPTTQELVSGLVEKYLEIYARAIESGLSLEDAHKATALLIESGLYNYKAEVK